MSQRAVEATLGKLICDDEFRREFFGDALETIARCRVSLTDVELTSLQTIDRGHVERLAHTLDDRIRRVDLLPQD